MYKFRLRLFSTALMIAVIVCLAVPAAAAIGTENLLQNPAWEINEDGVASWSKSSGAADLEWTQIVMTDGQGPTTDNYINLSNLSAAYISTTGYRMDFSSEGKAYLTFYYKSVETSSARFVITGYYYDEVQGKYVGAETKVDLGPTAGKWKYYKYIYAPSQLSGNTLTHATLSFRTMAIDSNIGFAFPSFVTGAPEILLLNGDFEEGSTSPQGWGFGGSSAGDTASYETNSVTGNKYVKIINDDLGLPYYSQSSSELVNGARYKFTFKFMPTTISDTPRVDISTMDSANRTVDGNTYKSFQSKCTILGTLSEGQWTEYVGYVTLIGSAATKFQILLRTPASSTACYDDVTLVKEESNVMLVQNGSEIRHLTAGSTAKAYYHHVGEESAFLIATVYKNINGVKLLTQVKTAEATNAADSILEMNIPASESGSKYTLEAFVWDSPSGVVPVLSRSVVSER